MHSNINYYLPEESILYQTKYTFSIYINGRKVIIKTKDF